MPGSMCLVMTIVFIEATGMFLALGVMDGNAKVGAEGYQPGAFAPTRVGNIDRRVVQHLSVCILLTEYRSGRGHRRLQPMGVRRPAE